MSNSTHVTDWYLISIATENFFCDPQPSMAKKQKASVGTKVDASAEVDIGPKALANLVEKLKHDLANSRPNDSKPKKGSKKKQKREDRMEKGSKSHDDHTSANKLTTSNNSPSERPKAKSNSNRHRPSRNNLHQISTLNGREKSQVGSHVSDKPAGQRQSKDHGHTKRAGASNKHESTRSTATTKKSTRDESLLQDILALGGTEEDLQLIKDIDSEEEIIVAFESSSGQKRNISNDDKVHIYLLAAKFLVTTRSTETDHYAWSERRLS